MLVLVQAGDLKRLSSKSYGAAPSSARGGRPPALDVEDDDMEFTLPSQARPRYIFLKVRYLTN